MTIARNKKKIHPKNNISCLTKKIKVQVIRQSKMRLIHYLQISPLLPTVLNLPQKNPFLDLSLSKRSQVSLATFLFVPQTSNNRFRNKKLFSNKMSTMQVTKTNKYPPQILPYNLTTQLLSTNKKLSLNLTICLTNQYVR